MIEKIQFATGDFYTTVVQRVQQYFQQTQGSAKGNRQLYSKTIILLSLRAVIYIAMLLWMRSTVTIVIVYIALGILVTLIGFNVMHDGGHGSYSGKSYINTMMGYMMNFLGSNIKIWKIKHNLLHHTYTNIDGYDQDINSAPFFRFHTTQKKYWFHRFQFIYRPLLYMISSLHRLFFSDFANYFQGKYGNIPLNFSFYDHIIFWLSKCGIIALYIILPGFVLGWGNALIGVIAMFTTFSLVMITVFQLAHMVEKTQTPILPKNNTIDNERAIHEVLTTANFAMKNKVVTRLFGGLNFQIEHHLFPHISHIHYPKISIIVQQTCKEFGIQYNAYKTFFAALYSHIKHLKAMGETQS